MAPETTSEAPGTRPKRWTWLRIATLVVAALAVGWGAWRTMLPFRRSIVRDAFVDAQLVNLAPQVQGEIVEMLVQEQERVLAGHKVLVAAWLAAWGAGAGLAIGPIMLTIFEGLPRETLGHAAGTFNIFRALPVFAVGTLLVVFHAMQGDAHFDRLRLAVTRDRPIVSATRSSIERRLASHGVPSERRTAQAHAVLAGWVGRNAAAFALEDVLRVLALVTAAALLVVPWLDPPPASRRGAASS